MTQFFPWGSYVVKKGERIFLTHTESTILLFFCHNPNKKIYTQDIIELLGQALTDQNIFVHMNRLRKKIEIDPKQPQLIVNKRPGYILIQ
ncbi:winged helix-turn-helix domain-containing protein [Paenibacillus jiagnxiensis]|uniref:winged helix-turn-helix domain-containing protein n=1 Tax=Paenibacillus jiagnxiensis TaxID=3228926 RepID=UPI0033A3D41B